jgi:hypothetical protein
VKLRQKEKYMSLENASGGFIDLDQLARDKTLVVCRIKEFLPREVSDRGFESDPVMVDMLICSGPQRGEVVRGFKAKRNGITSTLRRSAVGKDVAGVIEPKTSDKRKDPFVSLNPVNSAQMEEIKKVYRDGVGFDSNTNLVGASSAPAAGGGATAADEEPPF